MVLSEIVEGWRNHLIPPKELKEKIKEVSEYRLAICRECDLNSERAKKNGYKTVRVDFHCTKCGCTLEAKTKCLKCSCPINEWKEILTEKEDELFEKQLKEQNESL